MREHPIIFSGPMVRAILEGRKTQTRRVVKHPIRTSLFLGRSDDYGNGGFHFANAPLSQHAHPDFEAVILNCPYGKPGDQLWVRETFARWSARDVFSGAVMPATAYRAGRRWRNVNCPDYEEGELFWKSPDDKPTDVKWKPSIHMPRWASRITLEITDVRVQRVQDISHEDAELEGVQCNFSQLTFRDHFKRLWDSINAKRGFGWSANPYVWALTFKRVDE